jgi:hypothetical protein
MSWWWSHRFITRTDLSTFRTSYARHFCISICILKSILNKECGYWYLSFTTHTHSLYYTYLIFFFHDVFDNHFFQFLSFFVVDDIDREFSDLFDRFRIEEFLDAFFDTLWHRDRFDDESHSVRVIFWFRCWIFLFCNCSMIVCIFWRMLYNFESLLLIVCDDESIVNKTIVWRNNFSVFESSTIFTRCKYFFIFVLSDRLSTLNSSRKIFVIMMMMFICSTMMYYYRRDNDHYWKIILEKSIL